MYARAVEGIHSTLLSSPGNCHGQIIDFFGGYAIPPHVYLNLQTNPYQLSNLILDYQSHVLLSLIMSFHCELACFNSLRYHYVFGINLQCAYALYTMLFCSNPCTALRTWAERPPLVKSSFFHIIYENRVGCFIIADCL